MFRNSEATISTIPDVTNFCQTGNDYMLDRSFENQASSEFSDILMSSAIICPSAPLVLSFYNERKLKKKTKVESSFNNIFTNFSENVTYFKDENTKSGQKNEKSKSYQLNKLSCYICCFCCNLSFCYTM